MLYERPADRRHERDFRDLIEKKGCHVELTETESRVDMFVYHRSRPAFAIEMKDRSSAWPTIVVDVSKVEALNQRAETMGATPLFVIHVDEEYLAAPTMVADWPVRMFRRTKPRGIPGERADEEKPVYDIPIGKFVRMGL